jgi:hypothetical protein
MATNGVLFEVLKGRARHKKNRPPNKTSRLSFDTALYPQEYKNLLEICKSATETNKQTNKEREKD